MDTKIAFGAAFKKIRKAKGLTQEDFGDVSSRTYLSTLERGKKSITLEKLNDLAGVLGIHPLSLLVLTYANCDNKVSIENLINKIKYDFSFFDDDEKIVQSNVR